MSKILNKKLSRRRLIESSMSAAGGLFIGQSALATMSGTQEPVSENSTISPPPRAEVTHVIEGNQRVFYSTGVPDHPTGQFPSPTCPYAIGNRRFRVALPLFPQKRPSGSMPADYWRIGIALNGIPFDPAGPSLVEGWQFEVLSEIARIHLGIDFNNAHVQPYDGPEQASLKVGQYHYHGFPTQFHANMIQQDRRSGTRRAMYLLGFATDGFPIYAPNVPADPGNLGSVRKVMRSSYRLKQGSRRMEDISAPEGEYDGTFVQDYEYVNGLGDLDECNGREGVTPEYPHGIYHYIATREFPFVPRRFRGTPIDQSFNHPIGPGPGQVPPELLDYPY
jgi:hypothetical protein